MEESDLRSEMIVRFDAADRRADDLSVRIDQTRVDLTARIVQFRNDLTAQIDQTRDELSARMDRVKDELSATLDQRTADLLGMMAEQHETTRRHFTIAIERLESERNLVLDRSTSLSERLDDHDKRITALEHRD
ncbi:MAG TPA: hypothetical protein VF147_09490 [Vicinamibacterales bacterium]